MARLLSNNKRDQAAATALVDEFVKRYDGWRDAAAGVRDAYHIWRAADEPNAATAFGAYSVALDREEHAAGLLKLASETVSGAFAATPERLLSAAL
jgi:hypothetical protein